jgi:hypothetical protein
MNFTNRGFLSKNRYKQPDSQQPDYTGKLDIDGASYELAAWAREKDGRKYLSLKVQPTRDQDRPAPTRDLDESFPFEDRDR